MTSCIHPVNWAAEISLALSALDRNGKFQSFRSRSQLALNGTLDSKRDVNIPLPLQRPLRNNWATGLEQAN
jgi:hypothetical protein